MTITLNIDVNDKFSIARLGEGSNHPFLILDTETGKAWVESRRMDFLPSKREWEGTLQFTTIPICHPQTLLKWVYEELSPAFDEHKRKYLKSKVFDLKCVSGYLPPMDLDDVSCWDAYSWLSDSTKTILNEPTPKMELVCNLIEKGNRLLEISINDTPETLEKKARQLEYEAAKDGFYIYLTKECLFSIQNDLKDFLV